MKIKISKLIVMISVVLAPWLAFAGNAVPSDLYEMPVGVTDTDYVHGKLIFKVKDAYRMYCSEQSVNIPGLVEIMSAAGIAGIEKTIKGQQVPKNKADEFGRPTVDLTLIYTVSFDTSRSVVEIANRFLSHPAILYAEPWFISHPFFVPNDPRYNEQDEFHIIQSELAWDITRGDSNVVVGVIDTGTSFIHPEFQGKYLVNYSEPIDGIDNDNDGYIDNYRGWDFGSTGWGSGGDNDPTFTWPNYGDHGVLVTGPISAISDNGMGVSAIGGYTRFLPLKVTIDNSTGISYGYQGIVYAADHDIKIMNCSWGGVGFNNFGLDCINYAVVNKGCMVVAACGNSNNSMKFYPASFHNVMSVAATTYNDVVWSISGFGSSFNDEVDIIAPGKDIYTTASTHFYYNDATGTSMAAPIVSGVAALVKSYFPTYKMVQVQERVRVCTDNIYPLNPSPAYAGNIGKGRLNAYKALTMVTPGVRIKNVVLNDRHNQIYEFGDTILISPTIMNYLDPSINLIANLDADALGAFELLDSVVNIGAVNTLDSATVASFRVVVKAHPPKSWKYTLKVRFSDSNFDYYDYDYMNITIVPARLDINVNQVLTTVSDNGMIGACANMYGVIGQGIKRVGTPESMSFYGNFIMGSPLGISDLGLDLYQYFDEDLFPTRHSTEDTNSATGEVKFTCRYNDYPAVSSFRMAVEQNVFASPLPGEDNFLIFQYIMNHTGIDTIQDFYAGINNIWQTMDPGGSSGYDAAARLSWYTDSSGTLAGIAMLSDGNVHGGHYDYDVFTYNSTYNKIVRLSQPHGLQNTVTGSSDQYFSSGPHSVEPGGELKVAYAIITAGNLNELYAAAAAALHKYECQINPLFPGYSLGADISVCPGDSVILDAGPGFTQYNWSTGQLSQQITISIPESYVITTTDSNLCSYSDTLKFVFHALPQINLDEKIYACGEVNLDAENPGSTWLWNTGDNGQILTVDSSGVFFVTVINAEGCVSSDSTTVFMVPVNALFSGPSQILGVGEQFTLSDLSVGASNWNWSFGDGVQSTQGPDVTYSYNAPGVYQVMLNVGNPYCSDTASITLTVSVPASVTREKKQKEVIVFPNTNSGKFTMGFTETLSGSGAVRIISVEGATVFSQIIVKHAAGYNELNLDTGSALSQGVYILELETNQGLQNCRMVIKR